MKAYALRLLAAFAQFSLAQAAPASQDSATFDADGTAHLTRVVPMPTTISPEAQQWLASLTNQKGGGKESLVSANAYRRMEEFGTSQAHKCYPANVEETTTAGVRTDIITPLVTPEANRSRVLINLHGGGFNSDSGSLIESIRSRTWRR